MDELARGKEVEGVVLDEVVVEGWVVGEEGVGGCVGEAGEDVLRLEGGDVQAAQAGEGVFAAGAVGAVDKLVVLVLRFGDCADGAEGLRFGN